MALKKNCVRFAFALLLLFLEPVIYAALPLTIGSRELVYDASNPIADAPGSPFGDGKDSVYLFRSSWNTTFKYHGPMNNPQQILLNPNTQTYQNVTIPSALAGSVQINRLLYPGIADTNKVTYRVANFYLMNIYQISTSELLGFEHIEYLGWNKIGTKYYPGYTTDASKAPTAHHYRIGLVYSKDAGLNWTFLGDIIGVNEIGFGRDNIGGSAYILKNDSFYVYFNEKKKATSASQYPSVARAKISMVVSAAKASTPGVGSGLWKKYDGTGWTQNCLTGLGANIGPNAGPLDMHTDAAYCSSVKKYPTFLDPKRRFPDLAHAFGRQWARIVG